MHTAQQLNRQMFEIRLGGRRADLTDLLPGWNADSRLGVVVAEPLGALGASLLIQAAICAFFDVRPQRRSGPAMYAEVFLFHVGGRFGSLAPMDIWPPRKEVFCSASPGEVLVALNSHAITHLAVPAGHHSASGFPYKEPAAALDRLRAAYAYSPDGVVGDADIQILATAEEPLENARACAQPEELLRFPRFRPDPDPARSADTQLFVTQLGSRLQEVPPLRRSQVAARFNGWRMRESYRRIRPAEALTALDCGTNLYSEVG